VAEPTDNIAALFSAMKSQDKRAIRAAVDALIPLANQSPPIANRLNQLLDSSQGAGRWPIAYVLANLPHPSATTIEVLIDTLGSNDPDVRWAIALLLVKLASKAERIIVRLLEAVSKGNPTQRRMAIYCVRDLNLSDPASLRAIADALRDPDPMVRVAAVTTCKTRSDVGSNGENALLRLFLGDPDGRVRNAAAITLAQMGTSSKEFLSALERATSSQDAQLRKSADAALALLKRRSAPPGS
jgi:HEAT repeat protein